MKVFAPACFFICLIALTANADIIYFKDGMRTICQEKAWEEKNEIKCEYAGWIISYQKKDVLRIVKSTSKKQTARNENKRQLAQNAEKGKDTKTLDPQKVTGTAFYDPRRPYKYWSDKNSKHKSYKEAIQALAQRYKSSPEWIQANMGETNELEQIHKNLADPSLNRDEPIAKPPAHKPSGIDFYNPRRPFPYWSWKESKHKNYKEAIQALAQKYGRSPEWIQANMGTSNDLKEIHQNLRSSSKTD